MYLLVTLTVFIGNMKFPMSLNLGLSLWCEGHYYRIPKKTISCLGNSNVHIYIYICYGIYIYIHMLWYLKNRTPPLLGSILKTMCVKFVPKMVPTLFFVWPVTWIVSKYLKMVINMFEPKNAPFPCLSFWDWYKPQPSGLYQCALHNQRKSLSFATFLAISVRWFDVHIEVLDAKKIGSPAILIGNHCIGLFLLGSTWMLPDFRAHSMKCHVIIWRV